VSKTTSGRNRNRTYTLRDVNATFCH